LVAQSSAVKLVLEHWSEVILEWQIVEHWSEAILEWHLFLSTMRDLLPG
jgi:hypothetical protein